MEMDEAGLHLVRCQECAMATPPEYRPDQAVADWNAMWDGALKPCPFCGEDAIAAYDSRGLPCVMCRRCACRTAPCIGEPSPEANLKAARAAWNRRACDA